MPEQPSPEEVKEFQEKMKNMSPEELQELQKQQCIFCQIISGKVASKKVYEDDQCIGVLDINPANPGHILLMPKEHFPLMPLMSEDLIAHLFMVAKALSRVVLTSVGAEGANVFVANGSAAGQRAQHFMLHVIPRKTGDEVKMDIPVNDLNKDDVKNATNAVQERINAVFKIQGKTKLEARKEEKKPVKKEDAKATEKPVEKKDVSKSVKKKTAAKKTVKKEVKEKESNVSLDDIAKLIG